MLNPRFVRLASLAAAFVALAIPVFGQSQQSLYPQLSKGTSLEATADPLIARPHTKHCEVTLLNNQAFADFNNHTFSYTPPADCKGPWSKVILTADFSIQAGVQFDRTGQLFFGGVNIYFGTTAEPLQSQTDTWHVERDLTDYSSLFKSAESGYAILGNIVGTDGLTSTIFGTFKLEFYQPDFANPAPRTADMVLPLPTTGTATLNATTPTLSQSVTLPTNVENAYLDVTAQSQNAEEQWFFCLPNDVASAVGDCGNTAFRQVDISIDGKPAGVAPVYPWIYTGGVDPGLWIPIPGVQTLNLKPYRVDLSPFAGVLSDGQSHTVDVTVFNAFEYFSTLANLLVYEDHGTKKITGAITEDTLTTPSPQTVSNVAFDSSGNGGGTATITNAQRYTIAGYINTSHGRVNTQVDGDVNFKTSQTVTSTATTFGQTVVQTSTVDQKTTTREGLLYTTKENSVSYPINIGFLETVETNGDIGQTSTVEQGYQSGEAQTFEGFPVFKSSTSNQVTSKDNATFVKSPTGYSLGPNSGQASSQTYTYKDTLGNCYDRKITAADNVLKTVTDGEGCSRHW
ncbi:peptide-N4-asparagine amidase [Silvibacterium acidisoli]|uniref:peptide-N4-asparagine amidase n=1 Tax=Acidobacteriaceae bacterium ZG23-2 TaxID=2883246 RepID=UPI00406C2832